MRLVTFQRREYPEAGLLMGDEIVSLRSAGYESVQGIIEGGADALEGVRRWAGSPPWGDIVPAANAHFKAPLPRPTKFICVGLNYRDHALESHMQIPRVPTIFAKFPTSVIGHGEPIVLPKNSRRPDYEAEFAFVIGKRGRHVPAERWQEHIFGYTCVNDVSARDFQMATSQWVMGKTFDSFGPMGPAIVTPDEIPDPHALDISLMLNGERRQHSNTSNLIFPIPVLIEYLSSVFTLEPGDVVSTGTPAGVGFAANPPRWLRPGDETVVRIEGIGQLRNPCIAEA